MIYNEDDIKEKLNSQSANVDTGQLWNDLKHHAPIKKRRKWLPFLFVFTLGGILSAAMFHFFFRTPCDPGEDNSKVVIDSLMSENKYLQEKLSTALLKIDDLQQEDEPADSVGGHVVLAEGGDEEADQHHGDLVAQVVGLELHDEEAGEDEAEDELHVQHRVQPQTA